MNWFTASLLLSAACAWLGARSTSRWPLLPLAFVQPLVFLAACLTIPPSLPLDADGQADDRDFRKLGGIVFAAHGAVYSGPVGTKLSVGSGTDDLLQVDNTLPGLIDVSSRPAATLRRDSLRVAAAVIDRWAPESLPHTVTVSNGMQICVTDPAGACVADAPRWKVEDDAILVSSDGGAKFTAACALPHRHLANRLRALWAWPDATEQILPLSTYGRPDCRGLAAPRIAGVSSDAPYGFFHYSREGRLYFSAAADALGDVGLKALNPDGSPARWQPSKLPAVGDAELGASYSVRVYRVTTAAAREAPKSRLLSLAAPSVEIGVSRLRLAREFRLQALPSQSKAERRLWIELPRPVVTLVPATATCVRRLVARVDGARDGHSNHGIRAPFVRYAADFSVLGAEFEINRNSQDKNLLGCHGLTPASISATGSTGFVENIQPGDVVALGSPTGSALLLSAVEITMPAAGILLVMMGIALVRCAIRCVDPLWMTPPIVWATSLVDVLLVIRVIAAMQEFVITPAEQGIVASSFVTALMVPLVLECCASRMRPHKTRAALFLLYAGLVLAAMAIFQYQGVIARRSAEFVLPTAIAAAVAVFAGLSLIRSRQPDVQQPRRWLDKKAMELIEGKHPGVVWAIPLLHFVLVIAGMRERVLSIGVTAVFVPLYTVAFGALTYRFMRSPTWRSLLQIAAFAMVLPLVSFVLAHDAGAFIYLSGFAVLLMVLRPFTGVTVPAGPAFLAAAFLGFTALGLLLYWALYLYLDVNVFAPSLSASAWEPFVLVLFLSAAVVLTTPRSASEGPAPMPAGPAKPALLYAARVPGFIALLIVCFSLHGALGGSSTPCVDKEVVTLARCLAQNDLQTNQLRLTRIFLPDRGDAGFSREAVGMNAVFDEMRWLGADTWGGLGGRGFLTLPPRQGLDAFDGAPAFHLLGPFGRSAAAILLLWFVLVVTSFHKAAWEHAHVPGAILSLAAVAVFAFVSAYMLLANLELVPFTGRNFYLLASRSHTDLVEALLLLLLVVAPHRASEIEPSENAT